METLIFDNTSELRRERAFLEEKLKVKITIQGKKVTFEGESLDEYEATAVLEAINLGYSARIAILLIDEDFIFRKLNIKDFTRRKDLETVKARVIGTHGRTKRTMENLADCSIVIKNNDVGIIGPAAEVEYTITAMANLIRGSKQSNVYKFLERINTQKKKQREENSKS